MSRPLLQPGALILAVCLAVQPAVRAQEAGDGNPLAGLLDVLTAHGYAVSDPAVRAALVEGAARSLDAGARYLDTAADTGEAARPKDTPETAPRVETWPEGVGYLPVRGLEPGGGAALSKQLLAWDRGGLCGAILDLRGAGGGDLEAACLLAGLFAPETRCCSPWPP